MKMALLISLTFIRAITDSLCTCYVQELHPDIPNIYLTNTREAAITLIRAFIGIICSADRDFIAFISHL